MITAQLASIPSREQSLNLTLASLRGQVDKLFVALNGYDHVPDFIVKDPFIEYVLLDNSLGDSAKFYDVEKRQGYFFSCDDDLIYPATYIEDMIRKIDEYKCICSLHGRSYLVGPVTSYYHSATIKYHCLTDVTSDAVVTVGGTGVMGFHSDHFKLKLSDFKLPNMADIWVSRIAKSQGVDVRVISHPKGYLIYIMQPDTIWDRSHRDDSVQTKLINEIL